MPCGGQSGRSVKTATVVLQKKIMNIRCYGKSSKKQQIGDLQLNAKIDQRLADREAFSNLFKQQTVKVIKKKLTAKAAPKLMQMCLNFGQKKVGLVQCDDCLMEYHPSVEDDILIHSKYHQSVVQGLIWAFKDHCPVSGIIVLKSSKDVNAKVWARVVEILHLVNDELGAAIQTSTDLKDCMVILSLSANKKVVGCCLCKAINEGYRVQPQEPSSSDLLSNVTCDKNDPIPALCGISRIWTNPKARGQGIARKMLNSVRINFLFGLELELEQIAFSQPTDMGQRLAQSYFGRSDYLVYIE